MPAGGRKVWLFGALRVQGEGGLHSLAGEKLQSLFAFLVLYPDIPHTREKVLHLLWPEANPGRGARNLSNLLYRLKTVLGPGWLDADSERLRLLTAPDLWVDVHAFERLAGSVDPEALAQAIALYQADLVPELYDDWILVPREQLREKYLSCLLRLGERREAQGHPQDALTSYRKLLGADPLREEAARGLMRTLGKIGRFAEAQEVFQRLAHGLVTEIGVPPGLETRLLAEQLHAEAELATSVSSRPAPARFVGRVTERARLLALLDRARQGRGALAVLLGEAGIGKSRLLRELESSAGWRGWQVVWGQADEFALPRPYAPLSQALEGALPPARAAMLSRSVPPISLSIAAALVPGLPAPAALPASLPADQLAHAVENVLRGLQAISPHLVLLEDVQWADPALWPLLDLLAPALEGMAALLVVSARPAELRDQAAWETVQAWDRRGVPVLHVEGLAPVELRELAAPWDLPAIQLDRLAAGTGGNPLFALQLLQAGDLEASLEANPTLADLALQQVANLSALAQYCVQIAAVIGVRFDYHTWEAVLALEKVPVDRLPALAGEIEQARVLVLDHGGYRFAHDTMRAAVYTHLPEPLRRQLHRQALAVLEARAPDRTLDLLYHAGRGEVREAVARYGQRAGEEALASFAFPAAANYFSQALGALRLEDAADRRRALLGRVRAHEILGSRMAQRADLDALLSLSDRLDDPRQRVEIDLVQARYMWLTGEYALAIESASHGLAQAVQSAQPDLRAALLEIVGQAARDQGNYPQARESFEQALAIYRAHEDRAGEASMLDLLGIVAQRRGRPSEAIEHGTPALELYRELGDVHKQGHVLGNLGVAFWMSGDFARALEMFGQALSINQQIGDRRAEIASLGNLGGIHGMLGDQENALARYGQALERIGETGEKDLRASLLANRGIAYYDLQLWEQALASLDEALALNREIGRRRGEGYVLHSRGLTLIELGYPVEALESLEAALAIRHELGERDNLADSYCALARLHLLHGNLKKAEGAYRSASDLRAADQDSPEIHRNFHYTSYLIHAARLETETALNHLLLAEEAMVRMTHALPEKDRARFSDAKAVNRQIRRSMREHSRLAEVRMVRAGVPLGKKLTGDDYVTVAWTVSAPQDGRYPAGSARRRNILQRLLAEAAAQGAAPTDDDLARALGVSRRTVLRDIQALERQGETVQTRQRRAGAG